VNSLVGSLPKLIRKFGIGILGQGLSLVALFVPLLFGRLDEIKLQVFVSAIVSVALTPGILAFPSIFPSVKEGEASRISFWTSLYFFTGILVLLGFLGGIAFIRHLEWLDVYLAGVGLFAFQGANVISNTFLTRLSMPQVVAQSRYVYGLVVLVATTAVSIWGDFRTSLLWASSLSFLISAMYSAFKSRREVYVEVGGAQKFFSIHGIQYSKAAFGLSVASLLDTVISQIPALITPALGALAGVWAISVRVAGGFATVSLQLVNPWIESAFSRGVRNDEFNEVRESFKSSIKSGLLLAISAEALTLVSCFIFGHLSGFKSQQLMIFMISTSLVWGSILAGVPSSRLLSLVGARKEKTLWSAFRFCSVLLVLVFLPNQFFLYLLGAQSCIFLVAYLVVLRGKVFQGHATIEPGGNSK